MSKNIWVYIEIENGVAKKVGLELLIPAKNMALKTGGNVVAVVIGKDVETVAKEAIATGADSAIIVDGTEYESYNTESYTNALVELCKKYEPNAVLVGATQFGKDLAPRASTRLNTGCVPSAVDLDIDESGTVLWTTASYAGSVLSQMVCEAKPQFGTVRSSVFKKGEADSNKTGEIIKENIPSIELKAKVMEVVKEISEAVNLEDAQVIVAGGRGMGSEENFKLIWDFAELLGGVVGATRAPIESGWVSRAHQIGQSGKSVSPKLYIACGISGATQHVAGITGADYIVAINKDEDASIFEMANVGIVGNAVEVIPVMMEEISKIIK
ncbi:MAG: electron transfer flavoprotein subunit alpha/FixB family protein [Anaerotignaceae bacterium]